MALRIISRRKLTREELHYIDRFGAIPTIVSRRGALRLMGAGASTAALPSLLLPEPAAAQSARLAALIIRRLEIAKAVIEVGTAVLSFIQVFNETSRAEAKPVLLDTRNSRGIIEGQDFHEVEVGPQEVIDFEADAPPPVSPGEKQCGCTTRIDSRYVDFTAVE